jgi:hypothetical protein
MTLDEVKKHFNTGYQLKKITGMSYNNIYNWEKLGYVPILSQMKIECRTKGALRANLADIGVKNDGK